MQVDIVTRRKLARRLNSRRNEFTYETLKHTISICYKANDDIHMKSIKIWSSNSEFKWKLYQNWYVNTFLLLIEESIKIWETTEASERSAIAISSPGSLNTDLIEEINQHFKDVIFHAHHMWVIYNQELENPQWNISLEYMQKNLDQKEPFDRHGSSCDPS